MKRSLLIFLLAVIAMTPTAASAAPVEINSPPALKPVVASDLDVSLRLIGGRGAVLMPGRDINLTFQTSSDAYVIIYNIDTDGYVHLLYPADGRPELTGGRKVHFLPEQGGGITWEVGRDTGVEYIHAIAVDDPSRIDRDELYYLAQNSSMPEERRLRIDMDPFLAFNMIDEELIEDAERMTPSTDYTYFYINHEVAYPGYLCYKCHSPSKIPDPYTMECPEVDIEMIAANEDTGYPYPQLFAVVQAGSSAPEDEYDSYTYYADDLSLGYDDYDYDDQKVYLSVYYSYGWYPYSYYWPGYYSWYGGWNHNWYWDVSYGVGWGWGGCYYHHWPFYTWYPHSYHAYWHGYNHGYWDGYYGGGGYYPSTYYASVNRGSLYAGREFRRSKSLDYASTRVKTKRDATIASSRLVKERTKTATARSYQRSRLAKQVTREKASTGFRSFEASRYNAGKSERYKRGVYGNYGATRSARTTSQATRSSTGTKSRTGSQETRKTSKSYRSFNNRSTGSRERRETGRESTGSSLEKRVRERNARKETKQSDTGSKRSRPATTGRKSQSRSGTSARSTKDSEKRSSGKSSSTRKSSSRKSEARKNSGSSSPSSSSSSRSATKSSPKRSTGSSGSSRSSGGRSSGRSSSSGKRSSGRKR